MHINGSILNTSRSYGARLPVNQNNKNNQINNEKNDEKKSKKNSNSIKAPQKNKDEYSAVEGLTKLKESMQSRMESYQKRMAKLDNLKSQIPYEIKTVIDENGEEKQEKVYTEENQELLNSIEIQQEGILSDIKSLTEELSALDNEIKAAIAEEQIRKAEKEKEKKEKANASNEKNMTNEELKQKEEREQTEFFIQSDAVKKYIQSGKITRARLKEKEVRIKNEMANDKTRELFSEQRAKHAKYPIDELPVPDTSLLEQKVRIEGGKFTPDEEGISKELKRLQEAIKQVGKSIDDSTGEINKKLEERKEEQEKNRISDSSGQGENPDRR